MKPRNLYLLLIQEMTYQFYGAKIDQITFVANHRCCWSFLYFQPVSIGWNIYNQLQSIAINFNPLEPTPIIGLNKIEPDRTLNHHTKWEMKFILELLVYNCLLKVTGMNIT